MKLLVLDILVSIPEIDALAVTASSSVPSQVCALVARVVWRRTTSADRFCRYKYAPEFLATGFVVLILR